MFLFDRVTDWSVLRRVRPYRRNLGAGRGECIDRYYIEKFLAEHQLSIRGHVAEIWGDDYTRRFGGNRVERSDVLDIDEKNQRRTITIDLTQTASAPEGVFDCIICTQTILMIYDYSSAVRSLHKMLRHNGVLLVTVPGVCQTIPRDMLDGSDGDWWRFTGRSAGHIIREIFHDENMIVQTYGNVLTTTAFLHGLVQEELTREELEFRDPDYELIIGISATKQTPK